MTTLQADLEHFFQVQLPGVPPPIGLRPAVSVDENLNHPAVTSRLFPLLAEGRVTEVEHCEGNDVVVERGCWLVSGAWYEERLMSDGTIGHHSPLKFPQLPPLKFGAPIRGSRWTDEQVIWNLVSQFAARSRIFFLSENRLRDQRGIRRILEDIVAPILKDDPATRYGLMALWKKGRTAHDSYAVDALQIIRTVIPAPGYSQCII